MSSSPRSGKRSARNCCTVVATTARGIRPPRDANAISARGGRSAPLNSRAMYHVRRAEEIAFDVPAAYAPHSTGHRRAVIVGPAVGAVHTGITQCTLDPGGTIG